MYETILLDVDDDVATLTLNRPERLNAWTSKMSAEVHSAIKSCNENPDVGAMVVTGAGRGFCSGADIRDNFQARIRGTEETAEGGGDWIGLIRSSKPIIAAVNGAAVGVGVTMILPMDVIIASSAARFALAFVRMGVVPELGSSHFLVQRMGFGAANEMCLTGKLYSAAEAHDRRLVDRVVEPDELLTVARELASEMAANPTPQQRWLKQLLSKNGSETDIATVQRREGEVLAKCYVSPEHKEAVNAFLEKRAPQFKR